MHKDPRQRVLTQDTYIFHWSSIILTPCMLIGCGSRCIVSNGRVSVGNWANALHKWVGSMGYYHCCYYHTKTCTIVAVECTVTDLYCIITLCVIVHCITLYYVTVHCGALYNIALRSTLGRRRGSCSQLWLQIEETRWDIVGWSWKYSFSMSLSYHGHVWWL